jgi:hypothetical protein
LCAAQVQPGWSGWPSGTDRDTVLASAGHDLIEVLASDHDVEVTDWVDASWIALGVVE